MPIDTHNIVYITALKGLEAHLGHTFKDRTLINRALTHSSHSNETGERNHHLL